jgi:hypothetical protein
VLWIGSPPLANSSFSSLRCFRILSSIPLSSPNLSCN